jgi:AraC family transcriptional regulator of adaptative response/methylated-DNA-[protein]-cysteine methyltransferase
MNSLKPNLEQLRRWLLSADDKPFLELARKKKSILAQLTALSYDPELTISTLAIKVTGMTARVIAERDPDYVRNYLLRLFWLVNDESGGICWKAPELIGEILYNCPQFEQFFPILVSLLDMSKEDAPRFRIGTLWAIGRVAQRDRNAMLPSWEKVRTFTFRDHDPSTKAMALWCSQQLKPVETLESQRLF